MQCVASSYPDYLVGTMVVATSWMPGAFSNWSQQRGVRTKRAHIAGDIFCLQSKKIKTEKPGNSNSEILNFKIQTQGPPYLSQEACPSGFLKHMLLTKQDGRTGRISARGLDSSDWAQQGPYRKNRGLIMMFLQCAVRAGKPFPWKFNVSAVQTRKCGEDLLQRQFPLVKTPMPAHRGKHLTGTFSC